MSIDVIAALLRGEGADLSGVTLDLSGIPAFNAHVYAFTRTISARRNPHLWRSRRCCVTKPVRPTKDSHVPLNWMRLEQPPPKGIVTGQIASHKLLSSGQVGNRHDQDSLPQDRRRRVHRILPRGWPGRCAGRSVTSRISKGPPYVSRTD